jgi:phosphoglycolate phosphatase-like HAD superfamily hydrolase
VNRPDSTDVVVFDFDGTIVDSMPFLTETAVSLLSDRYGMEETDARRAYVDTCGLPFSKQMEIISPGDERNASTVRDFEAAKLARLMDFGLFPDALPTISSIRRHGIKVCVSSGSMEDLIVRLLRSKKLQVDLVMGFRPGFEKGYDHFDLARRTFDTTFERLVFVGDSHRDAQAAGRLGIRFIARIGLLSADQIRRLLPGAVAISSLEDILPLLGIETAQEGRRVDATS